MPRAIILVMDSFGIGASHDAERYGDVGANTFRHIAEYRAEHNRPLHIPNLTRWGLNEAAKLSDGLGDVPGCSVGQTVEGAYGYAVETSFGKDTPSGHWEMAGLPCLFDWGYFPDTVPSFPEKLTNHLIDAADLPGILGNCHASGTQIIEDVGLEHIATGKPIFYTSTDSTLQIAAHETHFGLERLYALCELARVAVDEYDIGRVIARPFVGEAPGAFSRTGNRRDYATPPPGETLLDVLKEAGRDVFAIGKIADIFAHRGMTHTLKATGNMALFDATLKAMEQAPDGSLIFSNFVDFDAQYGHRRNVEGYADALEAFDARLPELETHLKPDDLVLITADHGCDPTFPGISHTREHVPMLFFGPSLSSHTMGRRETFADMGQTLADHLNVRALQHGISCLSPETLT